VRSSSFVIGAALTICASRIVAAQSLSSDAARLELAQRLTAKHLLLPSAQDPTMAGSPTADHGLTLEGGPEGVVGKATIAWTRGIHVVNAVFTAPLGGANKDSATFLSDAGLPADATVRLAYTSLRHLPLPIGRPVVKKADVDNCATVKGVNDAPQFATAWFGSCAPATHSWYATESLEISRTTFKYIGADAQAAKDVKPAVTVGYTVGYVSSREVTTAAGAAVAPGFSVSAAYKWVNGSQAGSDASQICHPFGVAGALQCDTLAVKPPKDLNADRAEFELRWWPSPSIALAPHASFDRPLAWWYGHVPVYFLQASPKPKKAAESSTVQLTGGADVGWTLSPDRTKRVFFMKLFIGTAFKLADF